jgi:hypothetical protein
MARGAAKTIVTLGIAAAVGGSALFGYAHWQRSRRPSEDQIAAIERTAEVLSEVFTIDRKYRSMQGPEATTTGALLDSDPPELLWIIGYRAVMVDADAVAEMPQDFMCHANLNLDIAEHRERFAWTKNASPRLFTLSQGQSEVRFPAGFGIPIMSDETLSVGMQVLNLNIEGETFAVRHRVTIDYVRDREVPGPMQPLFMKAAAGMVSLMDAPGHYGIDEPSKEAHGEGCLPGERAHGRVLEDRYGGKFAGHWVVEPGRQENHTNVTRSMNLPFDATVHYVATHLHPFAESLELRDLTANETVYKSTAKNFDDRIGLAEVDHYSSAEGFALHHDHEYELVSIYDNTSGEDQDSMAVMFLYLLDEQFERPREL